MTRSRSRKDETSQVFRIGTDAEADSMLVPLSASHAHGLANLRKTPDEVVADIARIRAARDACHC